MTHSAFKGFKSIKKDKEKRLFYFEKIFLANFFFEHKKTAFNTMIKGCFFYVISLKNILER